MHGTAVPAGGVAGIRARPADFTPGVLGA